MSFGTGNFTNYITVTDGVISGSIDANNVLAAGSTYIKYFNFTLKDTQNLANTSALAYTLTVTLERAS